MTNHRIQKIYLDVTLTGTEAEGLALQNRLSALSAHWLLPTLEVVLDRCAPTDGTLLLDQLELDLAVSTLETVERDLPQTITQAVERAIREKLISFVPPTGSEVMGAGGDGFRTEMQSVLAAFCHFLQTGRLPWSFRLPAGKSLDDILLEIGQSSAQSERFDPFIQTDVRPLLRELSVRQRLIRQFSQPIWQRILQVLSPELAEVVVQIESLWTLPAIPLADRLLLKRQVWTVALEQAVTSENRSLKSLVQAVWPDIEQQVAQTDVVREWLQGQGLMQITIAPVRIAARESRSGKATEERAKTPPVQNENEPEDIPLALTNAPSAQREREANSPDQPSILTDELYVDNAGLVILHPFLPRFFEGLGLANEDALLQPERALCLLHFMATGQRTAPEHELTLPKLLCNVPLESPTERDVALTEAETDEAEALLRAVVRHWGAVGDTSIDGLRGEFLVRPGKLSRRSNGDWRLQVETRTTDLLLDRLPWGLSPVHLPWMSRMVWVEWV